MGTEEQALHSDDPVSEIYPQALPVVYGYLLPRCGSVAVAEDLTSDTFMAAVAAVNGPAPPMLSTAWLIGVARHKLVDHWRRQERDRRRLRAMENAAEDQTEPWDVHLDTAAAYEALARLSANHRSALLLRYLDDLPVAQVADHLGRSLRATETLLARARAALRRVYLETEGDRDG